MSESVQPKNAAAPSVAHLPTLRRLGLMLLVFFGLHALSSIFDAQPGMHSYSVDIVTLVLGLLLLTGSLGAVRWLAFCTAGKLAGNVVVCALVPLLFPKVLWMPFVALTRASLANAIGMMAVELVVTLWILRELRRPEIDDALAAAGKRPSWRPMAWGAGVSLISSLVAVLVLSSVADSLAGHADRAVELARQKLGDRYQYMVVKVNERNGDWRATVVAIDGKDMQTLEVGEPPP